MHVMLGYTAAKSSVWNLHQYQSYDTLVVTLLHLHLLGSSNTTSWHHQQLALGAVLVVLNQQDLLLFALWADHQNICCILHHLSYPSMLGSMSSLRCLT
jgi:hypothetical protein